MSKMAVCNAMNIFRKFIRAILGKERDPLAKDMRQHMALAVFLAWIGLGSDGLSSANYGPAEAYIALGQSTHIALYIALMTALTVFVISAAYNQVIRLFPSGGGGYKVATTLLGPYAGLVSGAALIVDYVLTIAISVASGVDALFTLLPLGYQDIKLMTELGVVLLLLILNLRGVKEPLRLLVPLFLTFVITHLGFILVGIIIQPEALPSLVPLAIEETKQLSDNIGWLAVVSIVLKAYSLGAGTYTGIEAVSNNVHTLREPRVENAKWTMLLMAVSLAVTAGGLILLYLLWDVAFIPGQTLNSVVFNKILVDIFGTSSTVADIILTITMLAAAGILFVAANTGFLGGPSVLANMAADHWVPQAFSNLSVRLVTQNGIVMMGLAAMVILLLTGGNVSVLVVLYSINVFLTFTLTLLGLVLFWASRYKTADFSIWRMIQAIVSLIVAGGILIITTVEKFFDGGWMTVIITSCVITIGIIINGHYNSIRLQLSQIDALFSGTTRSATSIEPVQIDPNLPTAVFMVDSFGVGLHMVLMIKKMFPNYFKNLVFLSVGEVDSESYRGDEKLALMMSDVRHTLEEFEHYCQCRSIPVASYAAYGIDVVDRLSDLAEKVNDDYDRAVFFASQIVFSNENIFNKILHNQTSLAVQRHLHLKGIPMVILPMKI